MVLWRDCRLAPNWCQTYQEPSCPLPQRQASGERGSFCLLSVGDGEKSQRALARLAEVFFATSVRQTEASQHPLGGDGDLALPGRALRGSPSPLKRFWHSSVRM